MRQTTSPAKSASTTGWHAVATLASGVYGSDGARRASISEFQPGETCVVKSVADAAREDQKAYAMQRKLVNKLARRDPRKGRMVVRLLPTGHAAGGGHPAPVEVVLPPSCDSMRAAYERVSDAVLKSRQAHTPVLAVYAGDGTPSPAPESDDTRGDGPYAQVTHLDQVSDGDVLMYRCAHHPVPAAPRGAHLAKAQRSKTASLAAPRESAATSFPISVHRLGDAAASLGIRTHDVTSADAVAQVMMDRAAGAAGHSLRVPSIGLESMSLPNLVRRIKLAAKLAAETEITRVFLPSGAPLEHPSQLTPGVHLMYACKGDKLQGKKVSAGSYTRLVSEAAMAAAEAWTADVVARGRKAKPTDKLWAESAVVARAGSAARGIPVALDPMLMGGGVEVPVAKKKKAGTGTKKKKKVVGSVLQRKDLRPKSASSILATARGTVTPAFGSRVPFNPPEEYVGSRRPTAATASSTARKSTKKKSSKATAAETRFVDIRSSEDAVPSGWGGYEAEEAMARAAESAEALAQAVGASLHYVEEETEVIGEDFEDERIADAFLG